MTRRKRDLDPEQSMMTSPNRPSAATDSDLVTSVSLQAYGSLDERKQICWPDLAAATASLKVRKVSDRLLLL
jgi:hypothetical protein